MKVPTYTSQAAIPRQGQGLFTTVQLSSSAMEAPGLAIAERGEGTAAAGKSVVNFGIKRAEVAAESDAQQASGDFETDLELRKIKALNNPNTAAADQVFRQDVKTLESTYRSKLSTGLAKRRFSTLANDARRRSIIDFTKQNNKRVVDQSKANLDKVEQRAIQQGSDVNKSFALRDDSLRRGLDEISLSASDIGFEAAAKRQEKFIESVVSNSLTNQINQPGADPLAIIELFRSGNSSDQIIVQGSRNLLPDQVNKIADDALKAASRAIKARQTAAKEADDEADAGNDALFKQLVSADLSDPFGRALAEEAHERLLAAGYYTLSKRKGIEAFLAGEGDTGEVKRTQAVTDREQELETLESNNELTYDMLAEALSLRLVTRQFHSRMLQQIEGDRSDAENDSIKLMRNAFKYTEESDATEAGLKSPARAEFHASTFKLRSWMQKNKKASPTAVRDKALEIIKEGEKRFVNLMVNFRQESMRVAHSRLPRTANIPAPTATNIDKVRKATAKALVKSNDAMLLAFQKLINEEYIRRLTDQ